ncbi:nucleoside hydrolase [Arenibacter sp. F26102]|uniref:nucleoside hydrolase n=1 Tax=Arenibacter sp. F26102 TaxID=2926416 RepID=UPI001FF305ED|nr:nucleoside hydrolase [Arenibacter sp. F26102]MCK0148234.1 nucleoside hydrolase [Arenibacter sp. F26102]
MKKILKLIIGACYFLIFIHSPYGKAQMSEPIPVIFETDMGNDVDDALALAMLFRYADKGMVRLLGISNNKQSLSSIQYVELIKGAYGFENTPMASVKTGVEGENESRNFARKVMEYERNGEKVYASSVSVTSFDEVESSVTFYRRLLAEATNNSVVIISVGFSTNLSDLLASQPDQYSDLTGVQLVAKKVKLLSAMAGNFNMPKQKEFNIKSDVDAARKVFANWPTAVYISPFAVGSSIRFPGSAIEKNLGFKGFHPLVTAYTEYIEMPYDRQTWDLTSVLMAVEPSYFNLKGPGKMHVDNEGYTRFELNDNGMQYYMDIPDKPKQIKSRFVELIMNEN